MASTLAKTEWCSIFQALGTESYTSSVTFMKQLTAVAISTISYMRNTFAENNFTVASFSGLQLKILKKKCEDEMAQFLSKSLVQAFEAFDKKYLHKLVLCYYEGECIKENLEEYYIFEYTYNVEGVSMNIQTKNKNSKNSNMKCTFKDIEQQTTKLIRSCIVMLQSLGNHPKRSNISLRLYYNETAPEGYQAPGFVSIDCEHLDESLQRPMILGRVASNHHCLTARSYVRETCSSGEAEPSQNVPMMTQSDDHCSFQRSLSNISSTDIRCACNKTEDVGEPLITCSICGTRQHLACFGILTPPCPPSWHCCLSCADQGKGPHDPSLGPLPNKHRESLCLFRRALAWFASGRGVASGPALAARFRMPSFKVKKLMTLLVENEIIDEGDHDPMTPKKINEEQLYVAIKKSFRSVDTSDTTLPEALGSQEGVDPVEAALSPLEKESLDGDSIVGRVVPNPALNRPNRGEEDEMLKQFREAISHSAETLKLDELPLSGSHNPVQDIDTIIKDTEMKCSVKRKMEGNEKKDRQPKSGVKSKKLKR